MWGRVVVCISAVVAAACAVATAQSGTPSSTTDQTVGMPKAAIDLAAIPLGTDKGGTTPRVGYIDRCGGVPHGGPPVASVPWVGSSTWNATTKVAVSGDVTWHSTFKTQHVGPDLIVTSNGLPRRSGTFPVPSSDPAHAYSPDPSSITSHSIKLTLPYNPKVNKTPQCESGAVGIAIDGVPILDGFDAGGNDAAAVEVQDTCHGHPNSNNGYHYHSLSPCILTHAALTHTTLVGWALDGFGIYVEYDSKGRLLTNSALDACHGRTSVVPWHGKNVKIYHYDMTFEFPYTVGCFRGTPTSFLGMLITGSKPPTSSGGGGGESGGQGQPPGGTTTTPPSSSSGGSGQQAAKQQCMAQGLTPGTQAFGQCMTQAGYPPG